MLAMTVLRMKEPHILHTNDAFWILLGHFQLPPVSLTLGVTETAISGASEIWSSTTINIPLLV